jgi:hypothetical protein
MICGPTWHAECIHKRVTDDDVTSCGSYPADGGPPPNKTLPYCCSSIGGGWVNYERGSTYRPWITDWNYPVPTCSPSDKDSCV